MGQRKRGIPSDMKVRTNILAWRGGLHPQSRPKPHKAPRLSRLLLGRYLVLPSSCLSLLYSSSAVVFVLHRPLMQTIT